MTLLGEVEEGMCAHDIAEKETLRVAHQHRRGIVRLLLDRGVDHVGKLQGQLLMNNSGTRSPTRSAIAKLLEKGSVKLCPEL